MRFRANEDHAKEISRLHAQLVEKAKKEAANGMARCRTKLYERNQNLMHQNVTLRSRIAQLAAWRDQPAKRATAAEESDKQIELLKRTEHDLKEKSARLMADVDALTKRAMAAEGLWQQAELTMSTLRQTNDGLRAKAGEVDQLKKDVAEKERKIGALTAANSTLDDNAADLAEQLARANAQLNVAHDNADSFMAKFHEAEDQLKELQSNMHVAVTKRVEEAVDRAKKEAVAVLQDLWVLRRFIHPRLLCRLAQKTKELDEERLKNTVERVKSSGDQQK